MDTGKPARPTTFYLTTGPLQVRSPVVYTCGLLQPQEHIRTIAAFMA